MTTASLRQHFLSFFGARDHTVVPSDSLVPSGDPTLLLTSAGMVPFKQHFLGAAPTPLTRATSCQKCLRTSDIEQVGRTNRHLTFFEMLGNFSFGDYFKTEAIAWAWEFLTHALALPTPRLWITLYREDEEAAALWQRWVTPDRIVRLGMDTNFWTMGPTGPCGPCSEILYDTGEAFGCGRPNCGPGCDCDRFLELWNLVFTQFDRDARGTLRPLPRKNIDTGMGLERLAAVVQGKGSAFDTDGFASLQKWFAGQLTPKRGKRSQSPVSLRLLADHTRAITFLIGDGVLPANEGRGYILRRLLRRALRQGTLWGIKEPFLYQATDLVVTQMQDVYPELAQRRATIASVTKTEEEKFLQTLDTGSRLLGDLIEQLKATHATTIPGIEAFRLYDTYGFPLELTEEIAQDGGMMVDRAGFEQARTKAVATAKAAWVGSGSADLSRYAALAKALGPSSFRGYEGGSFETTIKALFQGGRQVSALSQGETGEALLSETPFYPEGGGQVGDTGWLGDGPQPAEARQRAEVQDTQAPVPGLILHRVAIQQGELREGKGCWAVVDATRRHAVMRHHTATHLLHAALRHRLGPQVTQAGSLVAPDRLRFDFTHTGSLSAADLTPIEQEVNGHILRNLRVLPRESDRATAQRLGALAFFGERYGEQVRCVLISPHGWEHPDQQVSLELCGGTHVQATGEIGFLKITGVSSIGSGLRRIEAVAGEAALRYVKDLEIHLQILAGKLRTTPSELTHRIDRLLQQTEELAGQVKASQTESLQSQCAALLQHAEPVRGIPVVSGQLEAVDAKRLGDAADHVKGRLGSGVVVLATQAAGKIAFVILVTPELTARGLHAGRLAKDVAGRLGGSGGGRPEFAQGGGKDVPKLADTLRLIPRLVAQQLLPRTGSDPEGTDPKRSRSPS